MYTLQIGTSPKKWKYKTYAGLRRRLSLQAETLGNGTREFALLRIDSWGSVEYRSVTFSKREDGNEWGWSAEPKGVPHSNITTEKEITCR